MEALAVCGKHINDYPGSPWSGRPARHAGIPGKDVAKDADVAT